MKVEVAEGFDLNEALAGGCGVDGVVLEDPGVGVVDVDGVEAGSERGIDVGAGTVADHPRGLAGERVAGADAVISLGILFMGNLDGGEVADEAGARELVRLLVAIPLGHEDEAVARGEQWQGFFYAGE